MIPQRVFLKGFMSYRDETEFVFDGAPLWVLAGRNGVGKSAVFDAITYALYGAHRGGSQNAAELINQQANELVVEFDFIIGDETYRIKRTLSKRKGSATFQAFSLIGDTPKALPKTEKRTEFNQWIERTIGLSLNTFTASALLQQNKSDLLLAAGAAERHQMIAQLVDLTAYIKLHGYVDEQQKVANRREKFCQEELQKIAPVDETELATLSDKIGIAEAEVKTLQTKIDRLKVLKEQAKRWDNLSADYEKVRKILDEIRVILSHREEIEHNARRLGMIRLVRPLLVRFADCLRQIGEKDADIEEYQRQIQDCQKQVAQKSEQREGAKQRVQCLNDQQKQYRNMADEAQQVLDKLNPQMNDIKRLEEKRNERKKHEGDLKQLPVGIEQRLSNVKKEVKDLEELRYAMPSLKQYVQARQLWRMAQGTLQKVQVVFEQIAPQLNSKIDEIAACEVRLSAAEGAVEEAKQNQIRAKTLLQGAENHLAHFKEVDGKTNCSYCGQPLTTEHLEKERTRLEREIQAAKDAYAYTQQQHSIAVQQRKEQGTEKKRLEAEKKDLDDKIRDAKDTQREAQTSLNTAKTQGSGALSELSENYKSRIQTDTNDDISTSFTGEYPTQVELDSFTQQVGTLAEKQKQLQSVQAQDSDCRVLKAQLKAIMEQLQPLEDIYSSQQEQEIRNCYQEAQGNQNTARGELQKIDDALPKAESKLADIERELQAVQEKERQLTSEKDREWTRREALQDDRERQRIAFPGEWKEKVATTTALQCQRFTEALQQEEQQLVGYDEQYNQLWEAQKKKELEESKERQIKQYMADVEQDARRSPVEIEQEEQREQRSFNDKTTGCNKLKDEKRQMEYRRDQRENWEKQRRETARQAALYKRLAHLLGPEQLQNHLLLQAQFGIVTHANEILSRISSGTLQIELRQLEEGAGASRTRTLDLIAYNSEIGTQALPVTYLSGSQKFRVAVGLALGIGQYTSSGTRQIESVIIDEGFGSLDKEGREEMIGEIRLLKTVLRRIILVSHQEEVIEAFDNGYEIELVDKASRVRLR